MGFSQILGRFWIALRFDPHCPSKLQRGVWNSQSSYRRYLSHHNFPIMQPGLVFLLLLVVEATRLQKDIVSAEPLTWYFVVLTASRRLFCVDDENARPRWRYVQSRQFGIRSTPVDMRHASQVHADAHCGCRAPMSNISTTIETILRSKIQDCRNSTISQYKRNNFLRPGRKNFLGALLRLEKCLARRCRCNLLHGHHRLAPRIDKLPVLPVDGGWYLWHSLGCSFSFDSGCQPLFKMLLLYANAVKVNSCCLEGN